MFELIKMELALVRHAASAIGQCLRGILAAFSRGGRTAVGEPANGATNAEAVPGPGDPGPSAPPAAHKPGSGGGHFATPLLRDGVILGMRAKPRARKRKRRAEMVVEGTLLCHGLREKLREDGSSYHCYCADIEIHDGTVVEIVGTDLQRALAAAQAAPGDRIRAAKSGRVPVELHNGRRGSKNLWIVERT